MYVLTAVSGAEILFSLQSTENNGLTITQSQPQPDQNVVNETVGNFYKIMVQDVPIAVSQSCRRFFHEDDLEFSYVSEGETPLSRIPNLGDYGTV